MPTPTYDQIATVTLGSPSTTVQFNSIPSSYKDLILTIDWLSTDGNDYLFGQFNNDTGSNYSRCQAGNFNDGNSNYYNGSEAYLSLNPPYGRSGGISRFHIMNYKSTAMSKQVFGLGGTDNAVIMYSEHWANTSAITSFKIILSGGGSMGTGLVATLYGVGS
jgi:hypothetical protein